MRLGTFLLQLTLAFAASAHAAEPPDALPDDLDALSLADKAPTTPPQAVQAWRIFAEGAFGQTKIGGADPRFESSRASLDVRFDAHVAPGLRAVFSDRFDRLHSNGKPSADDVNTLREAYLSWARTDEQIVDFGRVNVRRGAAFGYNPTDWFKEGALRSIVSPDPMVLRENRQGTVVLQGQQLWSAGSLTATFSPRLARQPNPGTFSLNVGATNPRNRWLLTGSTKFSDRFNSELLLYGGDDTRPQVGLNVSGLISDAAVVFGEFTAGKGRSLVAQALQLDQARHQQERAAVGLTYTTALNLSITAEAEYNSAAPGRGQWNALPGIDPYGRLRVLATQPSLQDLPMRRALFVYAKWKDLLVRQFDVSAFVRGDSETHSRAQWLEARYHWDSAEIALQWQLYSGSSGSFYGSIPQRRAIELALRYYL
ncbi:MAG: hypothetical protein QFE16_00060 [Pseudomonadota bacterium]|nr:hypothetical protein [Pseudomonadota bacterium]